MHYGVVDEQIDKDGWTYGESGRDLLKHYSGD
jgi:hypothetical protein